MKTIILSIFICFIVGCKVPVCEKDTTEKRKDFILTCIKNATPQGAGDYEDPSVILYKCKRISKQLYCDKKEVPWYEL